MQQSLKDLERAYKNFFRKRAAFPRFKKRGQNDAFRYPQGVKLDQENSRIFLPKLGWMRYRNSRQVTGVVKNVTVSQSCGKWYISIQTESEVSTPVPPSALPGLIVALILGLAGGVSLGPEHPIMTVNIALAVAIGARLLPRVNRMEWTILVSAGTIGALFGTPVAAAL
ncbi:chloride channel protein, partial [Klebsiella pneumoniae]|uniref:chloride channel protein n=1 Tax=Klebsiella pneumoniae TaxID=573 RepID=UPI001F515E04